MLKIKRQYKFQDTDSAINVFKQFYILFDTKSWVIFYEMQIISPFSFKITFHKASMTMSLNESDYTVIDTVDEVYRNFETYVTGWLRAVGININDLMKDYGATKKSIKEYDKGISSESDKGTRESSE